MPVALRPIGPLPFPFGVAVAYVTCGTRYPSYTPLPRCTSLPTAPAVALPPRSARPETGPPDGRQNLRAGRHHSRRGFTPTLYTERGDHAQCQHGQSSRSSQVHKGGARMHGADARSATINRSRAPIGPTGAGRRPRCRSQSGTPAIDTVPTANPRRRTEIRGADPPRSAQ